MPGGFRIAEAWVDIRAEDAGLRQQVERMIKKAVAGKKIEIPVKISDRGLRTELTRAIKKATAGQGVAIPVKFDSKKLRSEFVRAVRVATAGKKKVMVPVGVSSRGLRGELKRALLAAASGERIHVPVRIDVDARQIQRAVGNATRDANVTITPNVDGQRLRQQLLAAIRNINVNDDIVINTNIDGDMLRNQIRSEIGRLRDRFRVHIDPDIDTDTFAARIQAAARAVSGRDTDIPIELNPRINELRLRAEAAAAAARVRQAVVFNAELRTAMMEARIRAAAARHPSIIFNSELKVAMLFAQIQAAKARLTAMGRDLTFRAKVDVDAASALAKIAAINAAMKASSGHMSRWVRIAIAAALAVGPAWAILDRVFRTTAASTAVLVPMITGLGVAVSSLIIGMQGMGEVISGVFNKDKMNNQELAEFEVTLEGLSPSARAFADALEKVKGGFTDFRKGIQGVLFSGLDQNLQRFAKTTLPVLELGLAGSAEQFNRMAKDMEEVINKSARTGEMTIAFGAVQSAMEPLVPMPGQLLNALTKLTIAASPLLERMNQAFARWSENMTERLQAAFDSGQLQAAISRAGDTIVNFFSRIANNPEWNAFTSRMKENGPRMAEAFGHISEALIKILNALTPITGVLVGVIDGFAKFITAMPTEVLTFVIGKLVLFKAALMIGSAVAGLAAKLMLLRQAFILLGSQAAMVRALTPTLVALGLTAPAIGRVAAAMRLLGKAIMGIVLVASILWVFDAIGDRAKGAAPDVDKLSLSLKELAMTGKFTGEFKKTFTDVDGFVEKLEKLRSKTEEVKETQKGAFGFRIPGLDDLADNISNSIKKMSEGEESLEALEDDFKSFDQALAQMVSEGYADLAAKDFKMLKDAWLAGGNTLDEFKKKFPGYETALDNLKIAQDISAETMGRYGSKAIEVQGKLDAQKRAADGLRGSLEALNAAHRTAMGGEIAMEQAIDNATKAFKENGKELDINTEKGQDNRLKLLALAEATSTAGLAKLEETNSWAEANIIYERGRTELIKLAEKMGMSAVEAENFADKVIRIPDSKKVDFEADMSNLNTEVADAQTRVDELKQKKKTAVGADKAELVKEIEAAQKVVDDLVQKRKVTIEAWIKLLKDELEEAQDKVDSLKQKKKTAVGADKKKLTEEIKKAQGEVDRLKQLKKVALEAKDATGPGIKAAKDSMDTKLPKSVRIPVLASFVSSSASTTADAIRAQAERFRKAAEGKAAGGLIRRASGGMIPGFPAGGSIVGPGSGTSDSILARVSNGEFVVRAAAVKKYGAGFMNMINQGSFPGFAEGGAIPRFAAGGAIAGAGGSNAFVNVKVRADTSDVLTKIPKLQNIMATFAKNAPKTITLKATDQTKNPTDSAKANFRSIPPVSQASYNKIKAQTTTFRGNLNSQMNSLKGSNSNTWKSIGTSLQTSVSNAYTKVRAATASFSNATVGAVNGIKTRTTAQWNSLGNSMQNRTKAMYNNIRNATNSFGSQNVSKFRQIVASTGSAWGKLSPKFKPPVSYLIRTVINRGVVGAMNAIIGKLGGGKKVGGIGVSGFAQGGFVSGPGTATSDSIPARLSKGEFVMQARAVKQFGMGFMNHVNQGKMPKDGAGFTGFARGGPVNINVPGFAVGGAVGTPSAGVLNNIMGDGSNANVKRMTDLIMNSYVLPLINSGSGGSAMKDVQRAGAQHIRSNIEKFVKENFGGAGSASAGLRWAKTQAGKKYQWGGNGNPSWDCSGFLSAIESVIRGEKPHRRWSTHAFQGGAPPGWKSNIKAPFTIGVTHAGVGHTAGTIGRTNVESAGGVGVRVGASARGTSSMMFPHRYGYRGPNATKKALGGFISGPGSGTSDSIAARLSDGEYVVRADSVRKYGKDFMDAINTGMLPGFATGGMYTVKKGDTLSHIAARYKISLSKLLAANPKFKKNPNLIFPGQKVTIPGTSSGGGTGGGGGSTGGGSLPRVPKAPKGDIQDADAFKALKALTTLSDESIKAGRVNAEITNNLKAHEDINALLSDLWETESAIRKAFKGQTQTTLIKLYEQSYSKLIPMQKNLDAVNKSLESATKNLDDMKSKFDGLKSSVSDNIMEFGNISKIGKYGTSPATLITQLQRDVTKGEGFAGQLEQLKGIGLDPKLIEDIAGAGITGGGVNTAATLLKATPQQIAEINALQAQLVAAADKAGQAAAEGAFGAGVAAAQGIVNGLKSQQKAIEATMLQIAKAMELAIKQALGIASPSKLMAKIGNQTGEGYAQGITEKEQEVKAAVLRLGNIPASVTPASISRTNNDTMNTEKQVVIEQLIVNVNGTFDFDSPKSRRQMATQIAADVKEAIRLDERKRV
jgi:LysM repeat protein